MSATVALEQVSNLIAGKPAQARAGTFDKLRPEDGTLLCRVARSGEAEVSAAVAAASEAQPAWAARTAVERGELVRELALALRERRHEAAALVAAETGQAMAVGVGEVDA